MENREKNGHVVYEDFPVICRVCLLYGNIQPFDLKLLETFKGIINNSEVCIFFINNYILHKKLFCFYFLSFTSKSFENKNKYFLMFTIFILLCITVRYFVESSL